MNPRFLFAVFAFSAAAPSANAEWKLSSDESRINFVSVKAETVSEAHYFKSLEGRVNDGGEAQIIIPLDDVETSIDIRNERMRDYLFETEKFPAAEIVATIDVNALETLANGARMNVDFKGSLNLHGVSEPIETTLTVTRLTENRALIETSAPIILYADQFSLSAGIEKLKELAGLPSITPSVPVTASLVFERVDAE